MSSRHFTTSSHCYRIRIHHAQQRGCAHNREGVAGRPQPPRSSSPPWQTVRIWDATIGQQQLQITHDDSVWTTVAQGLSGAAFGDG